VVQQVGQNFLDDADDLAAEGDGMANALLAAAMPELHELLGEVEAVLTRRD
jgi:hypothetical protein